ncbi:MAG: hypothetical protein MI974_20425 [Chitinophagales bacterium]|nr:hypothetical protein [Chitinophagales bacterium]
MNMLKETKIGNLQLVDKKQNIVTLSCYVPWEGTLVIDLLDDLGRSYLHKSFSLIAGQHTLNIQLPKMPAGNYNAWISIGEKTVIEKLTIDKPRPKGNFFSRLLG